MFKLDTKNLFWNLVFILIIGSIVYFVYYSTKKVDYIWRWERIPAYIISKENVEIRAPFEGVLTFENKTIVLKSKDGSKTLRIDDYDDTNLTSNTDVYEGDLVAFKKSYKVGPLTVGLWNTLYISFVSILIAIVIGIVTGLCRISSNVALKKLAVTYVELIRGTPLLVQIFIFYFFIGTVFKLDRITSGIAALAIFAGAYIAEIVRAGIQSIPKGQMEASRSLGMNYFQAMRYVILPQAIKRTLPPMAGQFISLIKDSSLVSVISITDLTKAGREIVSSTFSPFEVWFVVAVMYLVLTSGLSFLVQILERRLAASD
ncbi:amino acid ABC transporter permease [Calditerrivibrio nitroreducens]|uniref:Putative glutamine transport system permease protein GlnP n=1 Tax=Calditerrivibrio nitroreducens (strain DSM 19672 / NBRC 101217 / Yu37-1) TaxID=768670 RepID=E4TGK8_CALNY|nr:amino acid ABC transporter permease [Calditerrivibrio nitroreducens]ADR19721.1 amino acid ABC transporter membrane protein, PAAT family [Calditerrivibrio nitroreducens DSM 19672]